MVIFSSPTAELVTDYLEAAGHGEETAGALFRPVKNNTGGTMEGAITADGIYRMVKHYAKRVGVNIEPRKRNLSLARRPFGFRRQASAGMADFGQ